MDNTLLPEPGWIYVGRRDSPRRLAILNTPDGKVVYRMEWPHGGWNSPRSCSIRTWNAWVSNVPPEKAPDAR